METGERNGKIIRLNWFYRIGDLCGGIQETLGDGLELGFNSDKSRYFYLGELRLQFIGKSQERLHRQVFSS